MDSEEIKAQRLKNCCFYKGEDECPFYPYKTNDKQERDKEDFWWQELYYVRGLGDKLRGYKIYRAQGGKEFNTIPAELLDVMISTWTKYRYYFPSRENPEELEDFYEWVEKYLSFRDKLEVNISPCR